MFNVILHDDVPNELAGLQPVVRAKMIRLIDKIKTNATALRETDSKQLRDGLFELRKMGTDIARGLYVYQKGRKLYIIRVIIKKKQKT